MENDDDDESHFDDFPAKHIAENQSISSTSSLRPGSRVLHLFIFYDIHGA